MERPVRGIFRFPWAEKTFLHMLMMVFSFALHQE
jgi:hypothetical protein